jgi:hypothetical protein
MRIAFAEGALLRRELPVRLACADDLPVVLFAAELFFTVELVAAFFCVVLLAVVLAVPL